MPLSIADIVNSWFSERLAAGAVARDTDAYNQVTAALPDLIARLTPPSAQDAAPVVDAGTADASKTTTK